MDLFSVPATVYGFFKVAVIMLINLSKHIWTWTFSSNTIRRKYREIAHRDHCPSSSVYQKVNTYAEAVLFLQWSLQLQFLSNTEPFLEMERWMHISINTGPFPFYVLL